MKNVNNSLKIDDVSTENYKNTSTQSKKNIDVLRLVFLILLGYALISTLFGREPITFTAFLRMLQGAPDIDIGFVLFKNTEIGGDWGIFEFMKSFIEMFLNLINVGAFAGNMLVQVVKFILYFLKWFFL